MEEWQTEQAVEAIIEIIGDHVSEETLSDDQVERIACLIVQRLEKGPKA